MLVNHLHHSLNLHPALGHLLATLDTPPLSHLLFPDIDQIMSSLPLQTSPPLLSPSPLPLPGTSLHSFHLEFHQNLLIRFRP